MHHLSPFPHSRPTLHNRHNLRRNPIRQIRIPSLFRRCQNPFKRGAASLPDVEGLGDLQRLTTAGGAFLIADFDERGDAVESVGEVGDRVEWELGWGWCIWEERARGVDVGGLGDAEVVEDFGHVLQSII